MQSENYKGRWGELDDFYQLNNNYMGSESIKYSFPKGLWKAVVSFVLFGVPIVLANFPEWTNLTVGGVLVLLANYLKIRYKNL